MENIASYLKDHPVLTGLSEQHLEKIVTFASNVQFHAGQTVFGEGNDADKFYIIRSGKVALELPRPFHEGTFELQRLQAGDVLGWSWFIEPYKWHFDARAREMTRAISFNAKQLRKLCTEDPVLGFEFTRRFSKLMLERLNATRYRLAELSLQKR